MLYPVLSALCVAYPTLLQCIVPYMLYSVKVTESKSDYNFTSICHIVYRFLGKLLTMHPGVCYPDS